MRYFWGNHPVYENECFKLLPKHFDVNVTAVCATKNIELVKSLGAELVIDYQKSDFTQDKQKYDLVLDAVGKSSFCKCQHLLKPGGIYISSDLGIMAQNLFLPLITPIIKPIIDRKTGIFPNPTDIRGSLLLIKSLIEQDKFKAVIDREFPFRTNHQGIYMQICRTGTQNRQCSYRSGA